MSCSLCAYIGEDSNLDIIQCLNETDAVTIASGLNIAGVLSVVIMENSGIRSACDLISRFEISHHIHNIYILSSRGDIGEENWWGIKHKSVTAEILSSLHTLCMDIHNITEFRVGLAKAIKSFRTDQASIVLNLTHDFFDSLRE